MVCLWSPGEGSKHCSFVLSSGPQGCVCLNLAVSPALHIHPLSGDCAEPMGGFPWRMKPTAADQPIHGTTQPTPQHVASADISLSRILFSARL